MSGDHEEVHRFQVEVAEVGKRLDIVVHGRLEGHSRSYVKDLVKMGMVEVEGRREKPAWKVELGQEIIARVVPRPDPGVLVPQKIPLDVIHQDASIIVVNKPPHLVVHPGNGRKDGTLANALAHLFQDQLSDVGGDQRPGIVHRLDRDTTGVMVVAKTNRAHFSLSAQFQERTTEKEYLALVEGEVERDGDVINLPLGRSRRDPARVVVDEERGKVAETRYEVEERFRGFTLVRCRPKSGRTHQIRVHLLSIGHPIACDSQYGRRSVLRQSHIGGNDPESGIDPILIKRQALHAHRLAFLHPLEGTRRSFEAGLPDDMEAVLACLREHRVWKKGGRK